MATWEELKRELHLGDAELEEQYEDMEPGFILAREILRARSELGITQAQLARRMGTSQSVVSRLEHVEGSPNLRTILALADAMDRRVELRFVERDAPGASVAPPEILLGSLTLPDDVARQIIQVITQMDSRVAELEGDRDRALADRHPQDDPHEPDEAELPAAVG
jgi:transcriptional regulator with XRE-family HTH domain